MNNRPSGEINTTETITTETITLGGGCFWCLEPIFAELNGVTDVKVGYSGGSIPNPSYSLVCTGRSGHAEVVQVQYDPQIISLRELLIVFFSMHDPTTLNRQGADVGTQYRSVVFYHSAEQKRVAEQVIEEVEASKIWNNPIVTEVTPFSEFYIAEDYHQAYYQKNPYQSYCRAVIDPKVAKFRKQFAGQYSR
jgi:peptide-methionine (S)-S-oxide reductase